MLYEWLKQLEAEGRRKAAASRDYNLVWKVLAAMGIAFVLFRIWQVLTGRW